MASIYSFTVQDASNEKSGVTINTRPYNVLTYADDLSDFGDLRTAAGGIMRGVIVADQSSPFVSKFSATVTDEQAQRELKWLVRHQDTVTFKIGRTEIPTADLSAVTMLDGTDKADPADTEMAAFITAYEACVRSVDGNTVNVLDVTIVGRNL